MDFKIKEPLHILVQGQEYVVRSNTVGVEKNRVVFFYDTTRTRAVGFSRDFCLENPKTFQISRTLSDREISQKDVLRILDEYNRKECSLSDVYERINAL